MKQPFKQRHPLFLPLTGMTVSILLLFILSYCFIINSSRKLNFNSSVIKTVAEQRSLSQQIVNSVAADNLEGLLTQTSIDSLSKKLANMHYVIMHGDSDLNITSLQSILQMEYQTLDAAYLNFSKQLISNISGDNTSNFVKLLTAENIYTQQLDNFANKITGYSNDEVKNFRQKEIWVLIFSILFVFLEVRFIFIPAIKKIEKQNKVLREISFTQAHIVRRPLANIQSLLEMSLDTKNQDPFCTQLLTLAKNEAAELDVAIKNNIHKSDRSHKPIDWRNKVNSWRERL